jgi:uncharacterized protein YfiM (DUF2279 family)
LNTLLIGTGATYTVALIALSEAWYSEQGYTDFHFFNDNSQWNQLDKCGHLFSAYELSNIGKQAFLWTKMPEKKAAIYGSIMSQAMMIPIEVIDGFSVEYGFSWGDLAFNLIGSGMYLSQELIWNEQRLKPKFSFHRTEYAPLRPEVLGDGFFQELLKDYNGQTYWLSVDISAFGKHNPFPKWLNIAAGYGADEMLYGREDENNANGYDSYRQYYLAIDIDLSHIKTKNRFVKSVLFFADMIHIPAPTLEYNSEKGFMYHWFYF